MAKRFELRIYQGDTQLQQVMMDESAGVFSVGDEINTANLTTQPTPPVPALKVVRVLHDVWQDGNLFVHITSLYTEAPR